MNEVFSKQLADAGSGQNALCNKLRDPGARFRLISFK